jgi:hypothetical protein
MRAPWVIAVIWLAVAHTARAAELRVVDMPGGKGPAILLSGVIAPGDEAAFHELAASFEKATLITTGPGGNVAEAITIGTEIRNRGWSTLVPENTRCASACSMIWLAGQTRLLAAGAQIGFHAISRVQNGVRTEDHDEDFYLRKWLFDLGYEIDVTETMVNTPADSMRWFDAIELRANGIPSEFYP